MSNLPPGTSLLSHFGFTKRPKRDGPLPADLVSAADHAAQLPAAAREAAAVLDREMAARRNEVARAAAAAKRPVGRPLTPLFMPNIDVAAVLPATTGIVRPAIQGDYGSES